MVWADIHEVLTYAWIGAVSEATHVVVVVEIAAGVVQNLVPVHRKEVAHAMHVTEQNPAIGDLAKGGQVERAYASV